MQFTFYNSLTQASQFYAAVWMIQGAEKNSISDLFSDLRKQIKFMKNSNLSQLSIDVL